MIMEQSNAAYPVTQKSVLGTGGIENRELKKLFGHMSEKVAGGN
jgi:hypothetical protein